MQHIRHQSMTKVLLALTAVLLIVSKVQGGNVDRDQAIRLWLAAAQKNHHPAQGQIDSKLGFIEKTRYIYWPEMVSRTKGRLRAVIRAVEYIFS